MEVRWDYLTPPDFEKLVKEEQLCILPIGCLERHGDHLPFGTDGLVCHDICVRAAQKEKCVVFPTYWFGQIHEAACFTGAINFQTDLLCKMLEQLLDQIASNGFNKILVVSGHGGNTNFLQYFAMSQLDREVDYTLYSCFAYGDGRFTNLDIWDTERGGHADERETSLVMAVAQDSVKLDYHTTNERMQPKHDLVGLGSRVYTGLWWYDKWPQNVTGEPKAATKEKGEIAIAAAVDDLAEIIANVKNDTVAPKLQQEFYNKIKEKGQA